MTPTISVVIPTRNRAKYILESLDSVFAQTFTDYEVIVVDDGSTDNTQELLAPLLRAKKIRYEFGEARGVSAARNRGVALAQGRYIAFLDSDDLFLPTKLEKQTRLFEGNPQLGFVHCNFSKFADGGGELGLRDTSKFQGHVYPAILLEWSVIMAMPCMLVPKDVFLEVGGFDEQLTWAEDMDLWRRIARRYALGTVPEALVRVRVHPNSTSFVNKGGIEGFKYYLDKALAEDPALDATFRRRAQAKMYTKLAQTLLGEGLAEQMSLARAYALKALASWPLELAAILTWFATLLPLELRHTLAQGIRKKRYPR
jgi:glycosyltransferase involved in cell wall biosynthesis